LQLKATYSSSNSKRGIQITTGTPSLIICIKNVIAIDNSNNTYTGINCNDVDATIVINNNLIYTLAGGQRAIRMNDCAGAKIYNNTVEGFSVAGIDETTANTVIIKNNVSFQNADDIVGGDTVDYNATEDEGTGGNNIVPANWANELVDSGAFNYNIKDINAEIYHAGHNQTADADIPSDDIKYQTRPTGANPVSIGAFELIAAAPSGIPILRRRRECA
jgi:hypothetical protein